MNWLNKLERKYRRFAIPNLINYLVGLTSIAFVLNFVSGNVLSQKLIFDRDLILGGEVWRIVSYIFAPESMSLWTVFIIYLLYLVGTGLEQEWGSFKFNFYYLIGFISTTLGAFISGGGTATYLSASLFLAFAYIYPNYEMLLFFFVPVKIKYLGMLTWLVYAYSLLFSPFYIKIAILVSVINFLIFFYGDLIKSIKNKNKVSNNRQKFKVLKYEAETTHKCTICGRTEKDDAKLEFRYCSKCEGRHAYCSEHLFSHTHLTKNK